jgi:glycosyltransferase involved in cell wall biosynthesis
LPLGAGKLRRSGTDSPPQLRMSDRPSKISVIIPCFNEEEVLPELFRRVTAAADAWSCDWDVLCINDGSRDGTWAALEAQHRLDPRWKAVSFARNFGHQTAVSAGLFYAEGDAVIVMDADLQDPPEQLGSFLAKWREGYQVVYAIRESRKEGPLKRAAYWAFYRVFSRMVSFPVPLDSGDFCLMDRRVVDLIKSMPERTRFVRGLRAWCGFRQIGIPYARAARAAGEPKYSFSKLTKLALDGVFSFSTLPLSWTTTAGVWIALLALAGMLFTLATKIFRNFFEDIGFPPVQGFTTIVCSVLFLGGIQLISLGILGQYVARIYEEVKQRPPWIVSEAAGLDPGPPPSR